MPQPLCEPWLRSYPCPPRPLGHRESGLHLYSCRASGAPHCQLWVGQAPPGFSASSRDGPVTWPRDDSLAGTQSGTLDQAWRQRSGGQSRSWIPDKTQAKVGPAHGGSASCTGATHTSWVWMLGGHPSLNSTQAGASLHAGPAVSSPTMSCHPILSGVWEHHSVWDHRPILIAARAQVPAQHPLLRTGEEVQRSDPLPKCQDVGSAVQS